MGLEPVAKAALTATLEPSGELRLALRLPGRNIYRMPPMRYDEYGMPEAAPLVYSFKSGETHLTHGGHGDLPRHSSLGRRGKRAIKSLVGALETQFGKRCLFGTITLAGSTPEAKEQLARWSGKVTELLRKWMAYWAPGAHMVYVWELQKRGALHLHLAVGAAEIEALRTLKTRFRDYVNRLHETLCRLSGHDVFAREDGGSWRGFPEILRSELVDIRKSVKRYLAKYLSKGSPDIEAHSPSRWWGCNKLARELCNRLRQVRRVVSDKPDALVRVYEHQTSVWVQREITTFSWCEAMHPHNRTAVAYPDAESLENVWESALFLLTDGVAQAEANNGSHTHARAPCPLRVLLT